MQLPPPESRLSPGRGARASEPWPGGQVERGDPATTALLERLLAPDSPAEGAPPSAPEPPDERPLALLLPLEFGAGPFVSAGAEVPEAALELAFTRSLEAFFALRGPLRGPGRIALAELGLGAALEAQRGLPAEALAAGRALEARYLLACRLEQLEHRRQSVLPYGARWPSVRDNGRIAGSYRAFDLASGDEVASGDFQRNFELGHLGPGELASAERVLAFELARLVADDLARRLAPAAGSGLAPPERP